MTTAIHTRHSSGSSLNSSASSRIYVFGQGAAGWRVGQPLPVTVRRIAGGTFTVSDDIFAVFGSGATWDEAEADYVASLVDYFLLIADSQDEPTRAVVEHLRTYLHPERV